jgi:hypothetical protein
MLNEPTMNDAPIRDLTELLLNRISKRPGMHIGGVLTNRDAMFALQTYILGYEECFHITRGRTGDRYIDQFTDWIHAKTGSERGPLRLGPIIIECNGDHLLALKRFFEYLELFDREVPIGYEVA